jgi:hypothetical protein
MEKIVVEFTHVPCGSSPSEFNAKFPDYVNCVNSPEGWGKTPELALTNLMGSAKDFKDERHDFFMCLGWKV